ncbi:hypothetical protein GBA52_026251 [Prunus armeniaca]|nr:hypothetical protein GBA52_026251 [Prunus armeniaca]
MVGKENFKTEDLNLCFEKLMMFGGGSAGAIALGCGKVKMEGRAITDWKDIPMELLLQILGLVDDQTVIMASGVCRGWRDAVCLGLTRLSLACCTKNMNNLVLSLAPKFTRLQTLILRQDKPQLEDNAVESIANFCHDLQVLDLSKSFKLSDRSLYALAHGCPNLTKLNISGCTAFTDSALEYLASFCQKIESSESLWMCQNCVRQGIADTAMCSLAQSLVRNKPEAVWESRKPKNDEEGLRTLNISQCTALTPSAVQAVCDSFPALHTCSGRHSLIMSGCLNLTSVHCACAVQAHRTASAFPHSAH